MKFKLIFILIVTFLVSCKQNKLDFAIDLKSNKISEYTYSSERDSNPINENWIIKDSLFLSELTDILKNNESDVIDILKIDENSKRTTLGFGYVQIKASMGKGYAGIYYDLIFKNGQVVSYEFTPNFPSNIDLKERYLRMYSGIFEINDDILYKRYFNIEEMEKPMKNINLDISLNENLKFLMTPFSGTMYGFRGGFAGGVFTNREMFLEESKNITPEICQILMNSKNPATRFMAIEHYMKNKSDFENIELHNIWIDKVFMELPSIETLNGCMLMETDSKELVLKYVNKKN